MISRGMALLGGASCRRIYFNGIVFYSTQTSAFHSSWGVGDARNILGYVYPGYCVHKFKFKFEFKFSPIFTSRDGEMQIQFYYRILIIDILIQFASFLYIQNY
eukprot:SAG11_NODE_558_length_8540_cov_3.877147_15_plen_102_part_01